MNASENKHLLRIEGVNLTNVLDDTSEISIRRAAGLMLREAVTKINSPRELSMLERISTGASIGLYSFTSEDPEAIQQQVTDSLNTTYPYLTFVVDTEPYTNKNFKQAHEKIIAKNRFRQFQQSTIHTPKIIDQPSSNGCCEMSQLHPIDSIPEKVKDKNVSASSRERFKQGRKLRQQFYQQELGLSPSDNYHFTDDLTELTKADSHTQNFSNLNDKMAVIYLDGNSFGKHQKACNTAQQLHQFDQTNQQYRKDFLKALIVKANKDPEMKNGNNIRLETLLWGGDEMILVIPAWKGFETIQFFYEYSKQWNYNGKALTYAGGIVFCQHKTPILQVIKSAKELAEITKKRQGGRENNYFNYLVLESIDYPTQSIEQFWTLRYGKQTLTHLTPLEPRTVHSEIVNQLESLPRGALFDIGQHWIEHWKSDNPQDNKQLEQRINRFKEVDGNAYQQLLDDILPLLTPTHADTEETQHYLNPAWLHLVELWDYIAPINTKASNTKSTISTNEQNRG